MLNPPVPDISIIIPAKDEERRLPTFLLDVISFCQASAQQYEIIVVDDGSRDGTSAVVEKFQAKFARLHLIVLKKNRGKGYAVKQGVLRARGNIVLFMDADGSTPPSMIEEYTPLLSGGNDIVIGSRVVADEKHRVQARGYRKLVGQVFNYFVHRFLMPDIMDTQCGFKMFRREVVRPLFGRLNIKGFGFDLELLYLARLLGYRVAEVPVDWRHVDASKTNLISDSWRMLMNIFQIRNWHAYSGAVMARHMSTAEIDAMHSAEEDHWWFQAKRNLVRQLVGPLGGTRPRLLDAGCGTGLNLRQWDASAECFGCDAMFPALQHTRGAGGGCLAQCDLERLCYRDGTFDVITALDVIEHVPDPERVVGEISRVLKAGGRVIITVPAFKFLWSPHDEALSHFRRYHRRELRGLLEDAGLPVVRMGYHYCAVFLLVAPLRVFKRLFSGQERPRSDTAVPPPPWVNRLLARWQGWELALSRYLSLPFGTTLYAIVEGRPSVSNISYRFQRPEESAVSPDGLLQPTES
ncbi:MAG: glycosyltransferase [Candidatus Omnitrophica bacterium]|nr:glycosyltransferase [Candidatus Omnitrophota bacterium]